MLDKETYNLNEVITGKIDVGNEIKEGKYYINVVLTQVYDWYDEKLNSTGKCNIENGVLYYEIENNLEKGLYTMIKLEDSNKTFSIGRECNEHVIGVFKIIGNNLNSYNLYKKVCKNRENSFNRIKYSCEDKNGDLYNVLIFSKNILVSTVAQYDDVQIFPYDYLKCTSEVDYVNRFLKDNIVIDLQFQEEKFNSSIPSCVYLITNIKAESYDLAEEYAIKKAELLNSIYSMLLKSHGHFFAAVTMNTREKRSRLNIFNTRYKGNLLLFADQGHNVLHYYKTLSKKNSYLIVYIKLLNEAIDEENRMMKYYRYWNILEGISEHYKLDNNNMKKWNGTIVKNKKDQSVKVGNQSLDKVFELIRINYSNKKEIDFLGDLEGLTKVKDFLSICYQRRCCCAHNGENCINDSDRCTNEAEKRCLKYNVIHKDEPLGFQDKLLRKLEDLVIDILRIELKKETGESFKINEYVNKIME